MHRAYHECRRVRHSDARRPGTGPKLFGGNLPIIITGVVALIAAGALQVLSARRS
jgi:hypothetical protein